MATSNTVHTNNVHALQNRLISLVAGYLLDANDEQKLSKSLPEEYKANLRKNVSDAIAILAKLTTGIDVNVRFHDVKGFEFTDEISIFDLMDISLVHGWLVDPQVTGAMSSTMQAMPSHSLHNLQSSANKVIATLGMQNRRSCAPFHVCSSYIRTGNFCRQFYSNSCRKGLVFSATKQSVCPQQLI